MKRDALKGMALLLVVGLLIVLFIGLGIHTIIEGRAGGARRGRWEIKGPGARMMGVAFVAMGLTIARAIWLIACDEFSVHDRGMIPLLTIAAVMLAGGALVGVLPFPNL